MVIKADFGYVGTKLCGWVSGASAPIGVYNQGCVSRTAARVRKDKQPCQASRC